MVPSPLGKSNWWEKGVKEIIPNLPAPLEAFGQNGSLTIGRLKGEQAIKLSSGGKVTYRAELGKRFTETSCRETERAKSGGL